MNALLVIFGVAVVLPTVARLLDEGITKCMSSFDRAGHAFVIWGGVMVLATIGMTAALARARLRQIVLSILLQTVVVAAAAIILPGLDFGSSDRSRQKHTIANMRVIVSEMESERSRSGAYPEAMSVAQLQRRIAVRLPCCDAWGNEFHLSSDSSAIRSRASAYAAKRMPTAPREERRTTTSS